MPHASDDYAIRSLLLRDLNELNELYQQLSQELADPLATLRPNPAMVAWQLRRVRQQLLAENRYLCLVALHDEKVVAYCAALLEQQGSVFEVEGYGSITELFVEPSHRRRGLASRLVEQLLRSFAGLGIEHVEVNASMGNGAAQSFLSKLGFAAYSVNFRRSPSG